MEQQIHKVREILNRLPKAVLIELLLQTDSTPPAAEPTLFEPAPQQSYKRQPSQGLTTRRKWTGAQDDALIYALRQGRKSHAEIGALLGRTNKAVCQRAVILRSRGLL